LLFSVVWLGAALAAEPRAFDVAIKAEEPARTLRVKRGEDVELRWSSDRRIQLHLHGYDIERTVDAGHATGANIVQKQVAPGNTHLVNTRRG
jgi:hypothetical protein